MLIVSDGEGDNLSSFCAMPIFCDIMGWHDLLDGLIMPFSSFNIGDLSQNEAAR
eukprot:c40031_g1_i1 orf=55-216(+)